MIFILQVVIGIFILGILVLIHELGHFTAAKACGIRVLSFSIGFGKPLVTKTIGSTEYRISAIPFGGYVHMAGEHPEDDHVEADDEFTSKPIWQRAAVAIAGPVANIIFSVLFLWFAFIKGVEHPLYLDSAVVGAVTENSRAAQAGILPGDSIIAVNKTEVTNWEDVQYHLSLQDEKYTIRYLRKGIKKTALLEHIIYDAEETMKNPLLGLQPTYPAKIGAVNPGSPADKRGIQSHDRIIAIDNVTIYSWFQLSDIVSRYNPLYGSLHLVIERNDSIRVLSAEPEYNKQAKRYLLGIAIGKPSSRIVRYSLFSAIPKTLEKTWVYTTMIFHILPKLPKIILKLVIRPTTPQGIAGPVGIIQMSGTVAFGGLTVLLNFIALIGINLGILNLFPLIITDGGVLVFLIIESIRKKPLSLKTQLLLNRIAIAFFITLFVLVTFNDIMRIPQWLKLMGK